MSQSPHTECVYRDPSLPGVSIAEVRYQPDTAQPQHWHEYAGVTLVVSGALEEVVGRRTELASALSVVVKPAGTDHANRYGRRGAHTFGIAFQPDIADAPGDGPDAPLSRWCWLHGGPVAAQLLGLLSVLREGHADAGEVERRLVDALACVRRELARYGARHAPAWLGQVREALDERAPSPPRVRDLAAAAGVHPVYLARQFRRFYGCSVTGYLKRRRVQAAARLLRRAELPLSHLAYDAGFSDQSHLCRVFKAGTGMTPLAFRRLAASG